MVCHFDQILSFVTQRLGTPSQEQQIFPEDSKSQGRGQEGLRHFSVSFLDMKIEHFLHLTQKFFLNKSLGPTSQPDSCPRFPGSWSPSPDSESDQLVLESYHIMRRGRI